MDIYASLFSCSTGNYIDCASSIACDGFHLDFMDGHAVPNLGLPISLMETLQDMGKPLQVHLMVKPVELFLKMFLKYKIDTLFIHPNWTNDVDRVTNVVRQNNIKVGIVWDDDNAEEWFHLADEVLFMTVMPGFGGQNMITSRIGKIESIIPNKPCWIDGGVNKATLPFLQHLPLAGVIAGKGISGLEIRSASNI